MWMVVLLGVFGAFRLTAEMALLVCLDSVAVTNTITSILIRIPRTCLNVRNLYNIYAILISYLMCWLLVRFHQDLEISILNESISRDTASPMRLAIGIRTTDRCMK